MTDEPRVKEPDRGVEDGAAFDPEQLKAQSDEALVLLEVYIRGQIKGLPPPATNGPVYERCLAGLNLLRKNFLVLLNAVTEDSAALQSGGAGKDQVDTDEKMSKTQDDESIQVGRIPGNEQTQAGNDNAGAGGSVPGNEASAEEVQG